MNLIVNVAGKPVEVEADPMRPLWRVRSQAWGLTGLTGEPPENWEMRDERGFLLHQEQQVGAFDFDPGTTLFLGRKPAIGA